MTAATDTTGDHTQTASERATSNSETRDGRPGFRGAVDRLLKTRQLSEDDLKREDAAEAFRRRSQIIQQDGVPKRIRRQLQGLERTIPVERVGQFVKDLGKGHWCLILSSPPGTGKSTAAAYWLWNISPERNPVPGPTTRRWWTACELANVDTYGGELTLLKNSGPLVIDDLGTEYADKHGHFDRILDELFDGRYREELPTLITTNLNHRAFVKRYGDRIADRIREGGAFYEFKGKSLRGNS